MKKETVSKIISKILNKVVSFEIDYFPYEETKGYYKNIYKIITSNKTYVLKKAKGNELDIYSSLNNNAPHIARFYGSYHYYKNDYILFDYVEGHNLMKMDRASLIKTVTAIIDIQKKYWLSPIRCGQNKKEALENRYKRLSYLPDELKKTYEEYIEVFKNTPLTFSHEDFLPFNLLINDNEIYFIDLEVGGILPYPTMLARLISHTKEDEESLFYLKKEDYDYAISYYFDNFIKEKGIDYQQYIRTMNLFIFNELIEWIYVYQKNNYQPNDFYNGYYQKALLLIDKLNNDK